MRLYCRRQDAVALADALTVDLRHAVDTPGPFFIGWSYWCTTADAGAGTMHWDLVYADPVGTVRTVTGANLNLNTAGNFIATNPVIVEGQSGASQLQLVRVGGTGTLARVSLRLLFSSAAAEDIQPF